MTLRRPRRLDVLLLLAATAALFALTRWHTALDHYTLGIPGSEAASIALGLLGL